MQLKAKHAANQEQERSYSVRTASSLYLYGIIGAGKQLSLKSLAANGQKVYTIPYKDISAAVSRSAYVEYDPTEENLLVHNNVLQEAQLLCGCSVLPLRFSTIAKSESDVVKILSSGYFQFKQKLLSLSGKSEVAVKVLCNTEALHAELFQKRHATLAGDKAAITEEMSKRTIELAQELLHRLTPLSVQHVLNDLVFDDMILNAAFLVEQKKVGSLVKEIRAFDAKYVPMLKVQVSGPYVPYSFTDPPPK